jgi:hypothetical protein
MSTIAAVGMMTMLAGTASAGFFAAEQSVLTFVLGALPPITVQGTYLHDGWATLTNNGSLHDMTDLPDIWKDSGVDVGTSLLTGVALITNLTLTVSNNSGSFTASYTGTNPWGGNMTPATATICPSGCLGGLESMDGQFIVKIIGNPLPFPLIAVGVGGVASLPIGQNAIVATGGPFITGKAKLTAITTNVISMPNRGAGVTGIGVTLNPNGTEVIKTFTTGLGFRFDPPCNGVCKNLETRSMVTLSGTTSLASASAGGMVTLISPLRIQTGPLGAGNIPGFVTKKFVFVPEPGTVLLLVSGAAGLIFIGRKRMKG